MKQGIAALNAITDAVIAYRPPRKNKKPKRAKRIARGKKIAGAKS